MESSLNNQQVNIDVLETAMSQEDTNETNLYPVIRHVFLTLCILLTVSIILFLIYQNGKSIYDKGI